MVVILVGRSGSGKSTVSKELEKIGYERIVTYTTRPPREGEIDGVDYHFISRDKFVQNLYKFMEYKEYETAEGSWMYGSMTDDYTTGDGRKVIVLDPSGVSQAKLHYWMIKPFVVFLDTNQIDCIIRTIERGDPKRNKEEWIRRIKADEIDFNDFRSQRRMYDLHIDKIYPPEKIANIIDAYAR